jgi:hypothetical protein
LVDVLRGKKWLLSSLALLDEKFLNASSSVTLVHYRHALKELDEHSKIPRDMLIRNLVSEHVHKLDASGFQKWQVVEILLI